MNILISSCLLGICCRYDGSGLYDPMVEQLMEVCCPVPVCPEIYGGMTTPREASERMGEKVFSKSGQDVTAAFQKGAEEALNLARLYHCRYAILKERSPSCGHGIIYDGTFAGRLREGSGVAAELLEKNGVTVFGESMIGEFLRLYKEGELDNG